MVAASLGAVMTFLSFLDSTIDGGEMSPPLLPALTLILGTAFSSICLLFFGYLGGAVSDAVDHLERIARRGEVSDAVDHLQRVARNRSEESELGN